VARALLLVLIAGALTGCGVTARVAVHVGEDGAGVVTLHVVADPEAVQAVEVGGGTLEERVRLGDLTAAGWRVSPWTRAEDGSATLVLRKPFGAVDEVAGIMREISGPDGPLRGFSVTREESFFSTRYAASGRVDLGEAGTGIAADQELLSRLAAQGVDVTSIDQQVLAEIRQGLAVDVRLAVPAGGDAVVHVAPGGAAPVEVSSSVLDTGRAVAVAVAGGLAVVGLGLVLKPRRRRTRGRTRKPGVVSSAARGPAPPSRTP
jgi:hypothetical protein